MKNKTKFGALLCVLMLLMSLICGCTSESETSKAQSKEQSTTKSATQNKTSKKETKSSATSSTNNKANFDNAVFIGDSVTVMLEYYAEGLRGDGKECLGKAEFLCAGSLGWANSLWNVSNDAPLPSINGQMVRVSDGVKQLNAKNVYIMLGMNDVGIYDNETTIKNAKSLISEIKDKVPDAKFYIQSVTPMIQSKEGENLNNTKIRAFDDVLKSFCNDNGYTYLDIYSVVSDENGYLKQDYCGDPDAMGLHFTSEACKQWVNYLMNNN